MEMAGGSETGAQLFARLGSRPSLKSLQGHLFGDIHPKPGDLIEFSGESGTGKTEILLNIIVSCVLPVRWKVYELGGIGTGVVFVDTQCQFSMLRVFSLLEKRVSHCITSTLHSSKKAEECSIPKNETVDVSESSALGNGSPNPPNVEEQLCPPTAEEIENFIKSCLEKLYIIRCNTSQQLLVTLHSLETLFGNSLDLSVLMVDNWSAFYWMERASLGNQMSPVEMTERRLTSSLAKLLREYHVTAFIARRPLFNSSVNRRDKGQTTAGPSTSLSSPNFETEEARTSNQDFISKDWNRILSQKFHVHISEQAIPITSGDVKSQTMIVASRILPKPVTTKKFFISETGVNFVN